jgi:hypothetical protein
MLGMNPTSCDPHAPLMAIYVVHLTVRSAAFQQAQTIFSAHISILFALNIYLPSCTKILESRGDHSRPFKPSTLTCGDLIVLAAA